MKKFAVKTGVDPEFISEVLTSDITTPASIFDLIDNSIDAARNHMVGVKGKGKVKLDAYSMPSSYDGYEISLELKSDSFIISDNCLGISKSELANDTLLIGKRSNHKFGLGKYGVGLKRALLKLGGSYEISSDDSRSCINFKFKKSQLQDSDELSAAESKTSKKRFSKIKILNLEQSVKKEFSHTKWLEQLKSEIGIRYGVFINKGLLIKVQLPKEAQCSPIMSMCPEIDYESKHIPYVEEILDEGGVDIRIETGLHSKFKLNARYGVNNSLSDEYGWTVICNDRVIEFARREGAEFGWKKNWHSEYNGFVGYIRFYSKDVENLPWDSTKTKIQSDSMIFLNLREKIAEMALAYRSKAKVAKKTAKASSAAGKAKKREETGKSKAGSGNKNSLKVSPSSSSATHVHTQDWDFLLPTDFAVADKGEALDNLIIESRGLDISEFAYTSVILYRTLFEAVCKEYVKQKGCFEDVQDHYYEKGEGKNKNPSEDYKKEQGIGLNMIVGWMLDTTEIFKPDDKKELVQCLRDLRRHLKKMNGVVHCRQIIGTAEVENIRNETYSLLAFLVAEIANA